VYPILWGATLDDYMGTLCYNVGQPFRVGRNVVEDFGWGTDGASTGFAMAYDYDNNDVPTVGGAETYLQGGDSGGPSFGVAYGFLGLTGIHWAHDWPAQVWSYDTFVPFYVPELAAKMDEPLFLLPIPEPATATLLLGACLVLLCRRRHAA
jgi:hypothetical protein